eukprot:scaffold115115_cov63-Phaeocystis_antarctica.AAC.2
MVSFHKGSWWKCSCTAAFAAAPAGVPSRDTRSSAGSGPPISPSTASASVPPSSAAARAKQPASAT